ncbi:MAG: peptidylprolyl isomerase, partial [Myxococcota bacterium]
LETLFKVPEVDGDTVMTVGTAKVTKADLESALRGLQVEVTAAGVPDNLSRYEVLQSAADRVNEVALRSLLATELKVKVDPKEVDAWVKDLELRMEENPSFKAFLLRAGKDKKARRIDGERAIQWKRIQDTVFDQVLEESEDLARSHYDKNRPQYIEREGVETWRIVMKAPRGMVQRDRDAAESRAKKIHERAVKDPSSFEILAQMHSQGGKGRHGGFIGWVPRNTLNKDLEEMIYSAKPGTILPLQEAPTGYTIYKVGRHRDERVKPFDSVKGDILRKVFPARINKKVAAHLERLRAKYPAETNIPELAVLAPRKRRVKTGG